jgi:hypothetical protein
MRRQLRPRALAGACRDLCETQGEEMKNHGAIVVALGCVMFVTADRASGQSLFDGTWRVDLQTAQIVDKDELSLRSGVFRCSTCEPKLEVPADGQDHAVAGSPHVDTVSVRVVNAQVGEITCKKAGTITRSSTMTASADGKTTLTDWVFVAESGQRATGQYRSTRVAPAPAGSHAISGAWHSEKIVSASENVMTVTFKTTGGTFSMTDQMGDTYAAKFDGKDYPYKGDPGVTTGLTAEDRREDD